MNERPSRTLPVAVGAIAAVADLLTKGWVFAAIPKGTHVVVLGDLLWFDPTYNPFGPWSWGHGWRFLRFVLPVLSVAAVVLIGRIFWKSDPADRVRAYGLTLILGGAVGNLWDRTAAALDPAFEGVRDFVRVRGVWFQPTDGFWKVWTWRWGTDFPAFNLADACITVGVVLVALRILFEAPAESAAAAPAAADAAAGAGARVDGVRS